MHHTPSHHVSTNNTEMAFPHASRKHQSSRQCKYYQPRKVEDTNPNVDMQGTVDDTRSWISTNGTEMSPRLCYVRIAELMTKQIFVGIEFGWPN